MNMYDVVPRHIVEYKTDQNGKITLLKPKFTNPFIVKHLLSRMNNRYIKIDLDEIGATVWTKIDGKKNAIEIADEVEKELGEKIQPTYQRLGIYLSLLKHKKFVEY